MRNLELALPANAVSLRLHELAALRRRDDLEKKLARYASVEAKAAGMEEDMAAVLADVSQLHSQLLAAEHANTDLLAGRTLEQGSTRERDLLENIMRLEHQLKASGASIQVAAWSADLCVMAWDAAGRRHVSRSCKQTRQESLCG